ncbi:MAG: hypothetical protein GF368_03625 [Candidatus Aenigmarchaeota archaeon]|nr:hypothetical protein [Candidatus Aenigmarchaeota archaeon]
MEDDSVLIQAFGKSPKMRIIDFFLDNKLFDFSKKEIIEEVGMSKTTFYKVWKDIENFGIVKVSRKYGKTKLYKLNRENSMVKGLIKIERRLIKEPIPETEKVKLST